MPFSPRPYQIAAAAAVAEHDPARGALLVMATGTGKTASACHIASREPGRVLWLADQRELVEQPLATLRRWWPQIASEAGIVRGRQHEPRRWTFGSLQTVQRRLGRMQRPDLLIVDEAHRSMSRQWRRVIDWARTDGARMLGLTATPDREDGQDLGDLWDVVYTYSTADALRDGALVPPYAAVDRIPGLDRILEAADTGRSEYDDETLGRELLLAGITEHTAAALRPHLATEMLGESQRYIDPADRSVIVFTATVEQARRASEAIGGHVVHGGMPAGERRLLLERFRRGEIRRLANAACLTTGVDLPRADCLILARPCRSWSLYVQIIGRGLRPSADKADCLVIDLVGATQAHSLIGAPVLLGSDDDRSKAENEQDLDQCDHVWYPVEGASYQCAECGATRRDTHASIAGGITSDPVPDPAWIRLQHATRLHAVRIEVGRRGGWLYARTDAPDAIALAWAPSGARRARWLSSSPVSQSVARQMTRDLMRRAQRASARSGSWRGRAASEGQRAYLERLGVGSAPSTRGEAADAIDRVTALRTAIRLGIVDAP